MIKQFINTQIKILRLSKKIEDKLNYNICALGVSNFYKNYIRKPKFKYFAIATLADILKFNSETNNYIAKLKDFNKVPLTKGREYCWDCQELYVMKNEYGLYKIGISKNPERRKRQLRNAGGVDIKILLSLQVICAREEEKKLHKIFHTSRKQGEFFKFDGSDYEVLEVILSYIEDYDAHMVGI